MPQDALFQTKQGIDPRENRDSAWDYVERLRDPRHGAGLDEEELFGGLGESHIAEGFFIYPAQAAKLYDRPSSVDRHT